MVASTLKGISSYTPDDFGSAKLTQHTYRDAVNKTIEFTPSQILYGRELHLPCDFQFGCPRDVPSSPMDYKQDLWERLEDWHEFARGRIIVTEKYETRVTEHTFPKGDKVWFWNLIRCKGLSPELQTSWNCPFTVLKRLNDVVVRIQTRTVNSRTRVVHYDRLALCYEKA